MKRKYLNPVSLLLVFLMSILSITGCTKNDSVENSNTDVNVENNISNEDESNGEDDKEKYDGKLVFEHSLELKYAKNFSVDYYKGGYKLIKISDGNEILTIPEGMNVPADIKENVIVLKMPLNNMLVASTPTMSLINAIDMLDRVSLTTIERDDWYIDEVVEKMDSSSINYVGSYKAPDYEILTSYAPPFAIFSTMLNSVPEVGDKLKELKIPYILDQAASEDHPLARVEWVKLYGALFDCEEKASEVFDKQVAFVDNLETTKNSDKSVAIFYITSKGSLNVRQGGDYMVKMLELAGGKYIYADMNPEQTGTEKMEFEEFYKTAKDADYIIYIWTLGGKPNTLDDFLAINELFNDFKAVKDGNVWCTTPDYFQISDSLGQMIKDMYDMLTLEDDSVDSFQHLIRLK